MDLRHPVLQAMSLNHTEHLPILNQIWYQTAPRNSVKWVDLARYQDELQCPKTIWDKIVLRVDLNPRNSEICASWMTVWNISANYVLVPWKFNLNWNIWNPFLRTSPLDFSGQRLGNTSLVVFLRFHSFSQVVKWPEFVSVDTTNIHVCNDKVA